LQEIIVSYAHSKLTAVQFLDEIATFIGRGETHVKDIVLNNFPELLLSIFPVTQECPTLMGGTMANTHDVSMHSQSSQLSVEKGKDYMLKLLGLKTRDKLKDIMHVLRPLVYIMDPWREESITAIALDKNA
jgi:hypothetical protein